MFEQDMAALAVGICLTMAEIIDEYNSVSNPKMTLKEFTKAVLDRFKVAKNKLDKLNIRQLKDELL